MAASEPHSGSIATTIKKSAGNLCGEILYRLARPADELALRNILQSQPCWARGHLLLGELQLSRKEKKGAYASALAARELLGPESFSPAMLLARVYLQSGREESAVELLEQLSARFPGKAAIAEELAAGYMHQGKNKQAYDLLSSIPAEQRSPTINATIAYLVKTVE